MQSNDTVTLLKKCNAGIKMGVDALTDAMPYAKDTRLRSLMEKSRTEHKTLGSETHRLLNELDKGGKNPNVMARSMARVKTNIRLAFNPSDNTVADLMTEGCDMGVRALSQKLNELCMADEKARSITRRLISMEADLSRDLRTFL